MKLAAAVVLLCLLVVQAHGEDQPVLDAEAERLFGDSQEVEFLDESDSDEDEVEEEDDVAKIDAEENDVGDDDETSESAASDSDDDLTEDALDDAADKQKMRAAKIAEEKASYAAAREQSLMDADLAAAKQTDAEIAGGLVDEKADEMQDFGGIDSDLEAVTVNSTQAANATAATQTIASTPNPADVGIPPIPNWVRVANATLDARGQQLLTDHLTSMRRKLQHAKHVLKDRIRQSTPFQGAQLLAKKVNEMFRAAGKAAQKKYQNDPAGLAKAMKAVKAKVKGSPAYVNHKRLVALARKQYAQERQELLDSYAHEQKKLVRNMKRKHTKALPVVANGSTNNGTATTNSTSAAVTKKANTAAGKKNLPTKKEGKKKALPAATPVKAQKKTGAAPSNTQKKSGAGIASFMGLDSTKGKFVD